jgi:hypothetical protein
MKGPGLQFLPVMTARARLGLPLRHVVRASTEQCHCATAGLILSGRGRFRRAVLRD